jgi:hypothetical protein
MDLRDVDPVVLVLAVAVLTLLTYAPMLYSSMRQARAPVNLSLQVEPGSLRPAGLATVWITVRNEGPGLTDDWIFEARGPHLPKQPALSGEDGLVRWNLAISIDNRTLLLVRNVGEEPVEIPYTISADRMSDQAGIIRLEIIDDQLVVTSSVDAT